MKKLIKIFMLLTLFLNAQEYQSDWDKIEEFEKKNSPKSALNIVEKIYNRAKKENNETEFIKSLLYKEKYRYILQKDFDKRIKDVEQEIDDTDNIATKLILKSIVAQMYRGFLDELRDKRLYNRYIDDKDNSNIYSWSLKKVEDMASKFFMQSLGDEAKSMSIKSYRDILLNEKNSKGLRDSLYDFLAFRALDFFNNQNSYDSFYLDKKDAFSSINHFIEYDFNPKKSKLLKYKSILVYKKLLKFHKKDKDSRVLDYINMQRLQFVYDNFIEYSRDRYYLEALKSLESQQSDSQALYLARYYMQKGSYKKAIKYAIKGIKSRDRYVSTNSMEIKNRIEERYISIYTEDINLPNENILAKIEYKNIKKIYVKVVKLSSKENKRIYPLYGKKRDDYINSLKAFREFNISMPKVNNYRVHSSEVSFGSYGFGKYIFIVSDDMNFSKNVAYNISTISKIAYFHKKSKILVVDRESGHPLKDIDVILKEYNGDIITRLKSDKKGLVEIPSNIKKFSLVLKNGDDVLDFKYDRFYYGKDIDKKYRAKEKIYLFTDKALYRPSQRVQFKGLVVKEFEYKRPKIITDRRVEVTLRSSKDNRKIETKIFKTDEFGAIYGSFSIPKNQKNGYLYISSNINGKKRIRVEEQKKHKFKITFEKLDRYRLGDRVTIKGGIRAYSGDRLDGAKVEYKISRVACLPWLDNPKPRVYQKDTLIAKGDTKTNIDGKFEILFDTKLELDIPKEDKPTFSYRVEVDVTDNLGDRESYTKIVNIGYANINIDMITDSNLDKNQANIVELNSTDLYGNFEPIEGEIVIYRLKPKKRLYRKRYWSKVDKPLYKKEEFEKLFKNYEYLNGKDSDKKEIKRIKFNTKESKEILLENLEEGKYLLILKSRDRYGIKVKKSKEITIYNIDKTIPSTALWQKSDKREYSVGSTATIYIKSSIPNSSVFFNLYRGGKEVKERWIDIKGLTKGLVKISKDDRGDIFYSIIMVRNNRVYSKKGVIKVSWDNRLDIEYISFRDKIKPNSKEQWKIKIGNKSKTTDKAQMVATIYDKSLDLHIKNNFDVYNLYPKNRLVYDNRWSIKHFSYRTYSSSWKSRVESIDRVFYRLNWFGFNINSKSLNPKKRYNEPYILPPQSYTPNMDISIKDIIRSANHEKSSNIGENLDDILFFKPNLTTNIDGDIIIDFKSNNVLTHWNFLGFIHTKDLKTISTKKEIVTQKELMVTANLPKFFREGDEVIISHEIKNMSSRDLNGSCEVKILSGLDDMCIYKDKNFTKPFRVKKNSSTTVKFKIKAPALSGVSSIKYRVSAKTDGYLDIEESIVPILLDKAYITKSKAIYIKAKDSRDFTLEALRDRDSSIEKSHRLIVEFTSNPAWYAIRAMPYIMVYPHESSEALFNRYFVNALALKLLDGSSKMKKIFDSWKDKGQEKRLTTLFDIKRLKFEKQKAYIRLLDRERQHYGGGWSWFEGGNSNWHITQYIVEKFGRLKKLGIDRTDTEMMGEAIRYIDNKIDKEYKRLKKSHAKLEDDHLNNITIHYLYTRSFYDFPIYNREAYKYYLSQAKKYWSKKGLYEQAMIALSLNRKLGKNEAIEIANSIKKRAIVDNQNGIYFKDNIETHTKIMELFDEVLKDKKIVEQMKIWLLSSKGVDHWNTTKDTATAIDALLSDNAWILNKSKLVDIDFNTTIEYKDILKKAKREATKGIEYLKVSFSDFDNNMSTIRVKNPNGNGVWGKIYWQYFKDKSMVKSLKEIPISINKQIFIEKESKIEKRLVPISERDIRVGDKLKVEIKIDVDRDMKFIVLKDEISSAFTPINAENSYKYQDGLGYYHSTKDNASYLFFEDLPKGKYRFEYSLFVTYIGEFIGGTTTIRGLYSPNFRSFIRGKDIVVVK